MATPQGQAELLEKHYAHIRCPDHGGSTMAEPDPAEEGVFFHSYCCKRLQKLVHAEEARRANRGPGRRSRCLTVATPGGS
ncbi:hypothetical protein WME75_10615 [Sorangium sp. So ce1014]|uniref:hypothetical protein n=1 Tax=Sorangium sp. So ce1014 TaxID=3133326 RepID=UPI003F634657